MDDCTGIQIVQLIAVSYSMLMVFELIKLPEMDWYIWIHHLIIIVIACSMTDQSILYLSFRTDPYYVEITSLLVMGGSLMFMHQTFWVYFHLVEINKPTLAALKKIDTDQLISIEKSMQNDHESRDDETSSSTVVRIQQQRTSDCDIDLIKDQIKQLSMQKLQTNCKSIKVKLKILKLRQFVMVMLVLSFFGIIPFGLYFHRVSNQRYQKQETKWLLLAIISVNLLVEMYVFTVLHTIRKAQWNKYRKHELVLKCLSEIKLDAIQINKLAPEPEMTTDVVENED